MKKRNLWTWVSALLLTLVLAITGCDSDSDSDGGGGGGAQYGQVSGIVTDSETDEPIQGVTVALGKYTATTNVNGIYHFANVPVGDYPISFTKTGYAYNNGSTAYNALIGTTNYSTAGTITVFPSAYKTIDPDAEYEALQGQLTALAEYVKQYPDETDLTGTTATGSWEYAGNGLYVNGAGATIQYQDGQFKIVDYKLNYNYSFGISVFPVEMDPLNGKLSGKILVVYEKYNEILPAGSTAALANREFSITSGTATYGPYKTGADGSFTAANIPSTGALNFVIPAFTLTQGTESYSFRHTTSAPALYQFSLEGGLATPVAPTNIGSVEYNVGTLYLFTIGDTALVTAATVGTYASPLPVTDSIVFTFSKPMDPSTLPSLTLGTVKLKDSWNADNTELTLTPFSYLDKASILRLPYATAVSGITDTLNLAPGSPPDLTAADGSPVYPSTFEIYTARGLTLVGYEVVDAPTAARAVSLAPNQVVKLSFSEAISTRAGDVSITWYESTGPTSIKAVYQIDGSIVYVYPHTGLADEELTFTVAAAGDPSNTYSNDDSPIDGLEFSLEEPIEATHVNTNDDLSSAIEIAPDKNITIDFNKTFTNAKATLYFIYNDGTTEYRKATATTGDVTDRRSLTIPLTNLLAASDSGTPSIAYELAWEATANGVGAKGTITIEVEELDDAIVPARDPAPLNNSLEQIGAVSSTSTGITLKFTVPDVQPFTYTYSSQYRFFDALDWTDIGATGDFSIAKGDTTKLPPGSNTVSIPGETPHLAGEKIQYRVKGINDKGYVVESNTLTIFE
ncbi:MAG: carboxypeptidase-like regulatory domain-containing protein [Spirochaetales bacterium]|jgi:hypothetical protein|nr:carboxypeptidase-like regulatory domain-containing protein [Spirochaetales bacterium]